MEGSTRSDLQGLKHDSTDAGGPKSKILAEVTRQLSLPREQSTQHNRYQMRGFDKSD